MNYLMSRQRMLEKIVFFKPRHTKHKMQINLLLPLNRITKHFKTFELQKK